MGLFIYSLAKLEILEFVYDCIKKYLSDDCLEFIEMYTDFFYMALAGDSLRVGKTRNERRVFQNYDCFLSLACNQHKSEFVKARTQNL